MNPTGVAWKEWGQKSPPPPAPGRSRSAASAALDRRLSRSRNPLTGGVRLGMDEGTPDEGRASFIHGLGNQKKGSQKG